MPRVFNDGECLVGNDNIEVAKENELLEYKLRKLDAIN